MIELSAANINNEPIENILCYMKNSWDILYDPNTWNIQFQWEFKAKYRYSKLKNCVWAFWVDMPTWKPFNFVKSFYFSDLDDREAIKSTYNWYKGYYNLIDTHWLDYKKNKERLKKLEEELARNKIKSDKLAAEKEKRRSTMPDKFFALEKSYSKEIIDYFKNERCISEETLKLNNARTWVLDYFWKTYKDRVYFPMKSIKESWKTYLNGITIRDPFATDSNYKSLSLMDSQAWLLFNVSWVKNHKEVYFCEWAIDKMSLDEAGMHNSFWNMMWAWTFSDEWLLAFKKAEKINILYDFDKKSFAWLSWVIKVMKKFPDKEVQFLDLPKLLEKNFPDMREDLLNEFSDVNDLWKASNLNWTTKNFKEILHSWLVKMPLEEVEKIFSKFSEIKHKDHLDWKDGEFTISITTKLKDLPSIQKLKV